VQVAAEEARANLGIAKNVIELRDEAARLVGQAKEDTTAIKDAALQEAAKAQKTLNEWVM
jgi:hypothetical protein